MHCCLGHVCCRPLGLLCRAVQLNRAVIDRGNELTQRLDRIVDRIGYRTGDVLRDRGLHGQIAIGQTRQFIQQAHDGLLIALVFTHAQLGPAALIGRLEIGHDKPASSTAAAASNPTINAL